jgi:hypothetical protein
LHYFFVSDKSRKAQSRNINESKFYFERFGRPSIAASDAHDKEEIGRNYSWIKANPSFDGLLQIKYEPDTRVRIQEECPNKKASYTMIDYVEVKHPLFLTMMFQLNFF